MYYKIYGVMSTNGFNTELFNATSEPKALEKVKQLNPLLYPYFAITAHLNVNAPAHEFLLGITQEGKDSGRRSLIEYKPNPIHDFQLAEKLFTTLERKYHDITSPKETPNNQELGGHSSNPILPSGTGATTSTGLTANAANPNSSEG